MDVNSQSRSFESLVSKQLSALSELSEIITLRVLELEEKLLKLEKESAGFRSKDSLLTNQLLQNSEARVVHLQGLLNQIPLKASSIDPPSSGEDENSMGTEAEPIKTDDSQQILQSKDASPNLNEEEEYLSHFKESAEQGCDYPDDEQMPLLSA